MTFSQYGLTAYQVQYWNGSAWATIPGGSVSGNNKVWRKFTFAAITTTKIRVLASASPDGYSRIVELEAWTGPSLKVLKETSKVIREFSMRRGQKEEAALICSRGQWVGRCLY